MENVPPLAMNGDDIPSLDDLLYSKRNVKASRQKRSLALNSRTNADNDDGHSEDDSGLLTPPSSQQELEEDDMDPARMLFSPPPEEVLRGNGRSSVSTQMHPTAIGSFERSTICAIRPVACRRDTVNIRRLLSVVYVLWAETHTFYHRHLVRGLFPSSFPSPRLFLPTLRRARPRRNASDMHINAPHPTLL